jgi:hypothetical protein
MRGSMYLYIFASENSERIPTKFSTEESALEVVFGSYFVSHLTSVIYTLHEAVM